MFAKMCHGRLTVIFGILLSSSHVYTSTHWVVTEDGRLQEQPDSLLSMRKPHDLVAFMHQEERVHQLEELKDYISANQEIIDSTDDKDDGFEERFLITEESCVKATKRLPEFDLYISTVLPLENKGIRAEEHLSLKKPPSTEYSSPHCNSPLPFSMYAFEHLEGVQNRHLLQGMPELGLKSAMTRRESEDEYGHLVNEALKQNQTSWVLYNMAAFYWRIKGNSMEAIECLRRALHYSPRDYRDVAYVSLGNILHRSKYSHEAAIVVEAALDLSNTLNVHHFTLGNIYAVLTEYNRSVQCFDNTLALQPEFEAAEKRRWAVICHAKLEEALEEQHRNLQSDLKKLKEYQKKHQMMQTLTEKTAVEQAYRTERVTRNAEFIQHVHSRRTMNRPMMGEHCHVAVTGDERSVVCEWKISDVDANHSQQTTDNEQKFSSVPITDSELERMREETDRVKALEEGTYRDDVVAAKNANGAKQDYSQPIHPPTYAAGEMVSSVHKPAHLDEDWPSREECVEHEYKEITWEDYPSTFLPPENKGFDSHVFLTEAIDIQSGEQHALPWYPPVCVNIVDLKQGEMFLDHIEAFQQREKVPLRSASEMDASMRKIMLSWVNNGEVEEEEVGQRILTALKQNLAPRWLLYNLAGLYWRVVGNNYHAIECLRRSLHFVPADYVDVPLVNVANIFLKWKRFEDALNMTRQALIFCPFEPITHFTQANLLAITRNESGAIHHYEKALELDASYSAALDMLRNIKCVSKYSSDGTDKNVKDTCKINTVHKCGGDKTSCSVSQCTTHEVEFITSSSDVRRQLEQDPKMAIIRNFLSLGGFLKRSNKLNPTEADAMKQFHKASGLCSGADCDHIVHKPGTDPYIKIKVVSPGKWLQRLLFIAPDEEIVVEEGECYLLKNGVRRGCTDADFANNRKKLGQLEKVLSELVQFIDERHSSGELMADDEERFLEKIKSRKAEEFDEIEGFVGLTSLMSAKQSKCVQGDAVSRAKDTVSVVHDIVCVTTEEKDQIRCFSKKDASPDQIELPQVKVQTSVTLPTYQFTPSDDDCKNYKPIDFKSFTSTWLSLTGKESAADDNQLILSDVGQFIDLNEAIDERNMQFPICDANFGASVSMFDHLPSIADKERLVYSKEHVLGEVLTKMMGVRPEQINMIGARISKALNKDRSSWSLGCLGALYWRVEGNAPNAINCLRMALRNVPAGNKHIPLLSLANVLHRAGAINDAVQIALVALESSPQTVVIHFSIGNMYAAKNDFKKAAEYYQSTLALQDQFTPARERLTAIMCRGLLDATGDKTNN